MIGHQGNRRQRTRETGGVGEREFDFEGDQHGWSRNEGQGPTIAGPV
jgi:hypothetical protein